MFKKLAKAHLFGVVSMVVRFSYRDFRLEFDELNICSVHPKHHYRNGEPEKRQQQMGDANQFLEDEKQRDLGQLT